MTCTNDRVFFGNITRRINPQQRRHVPVLDLTLEQVTELTPSLNNTNRQVMLVALHKVTPKGADNFNFSLSQNYKITTTVTLMYVAYRQHQLKWYTTQQTYNVNN